MNKSLFVVSGIVAALSSAAYADPAEDCLNALLANDLKRAAKIVAENSRGHRPPLSGAFPIATGPYTGGNLLWLLGHLGQWELADQIMRLEYNSEFGLQAESFRVTPAGYPDLLELAANAKNLSMLRAFLYGIEREVVYEDGFWHWPYEMEWPAGRMVRAAAAIERWDIVRAIVKTWEADLNYSYVPGDSIIGMSDHVEGPEGIWGIGEDSILVTAAKNGMWEMLDFFFEVNPNLDLAKAYLVPNDPGYSYPNEDECGLGDCKDNVIEFRRENAVKGMGRLLVRRLALEMPTLKELGEHLRLPIGRNIPAELEAIVESFRKIFRKAALTYLSTWERTDLSVLPYELRMNMALKLLRPQIDAMGVGILPDSCLMKVLENFRWALNPIPMSIASKALALRFPHDDRLPGLARHFSDIRDTVMSELSEFLTKQPLMRAEWELVAQIVASFPLRDIRERTTELAQVLFSLRGTFGEREAKLREMYYSALLGEGQLQAEEQSGNSRKRGRDDNDDESERRSLRAVLTREVVAQAPGLTPHQVIQRVDDILQDNGNTTALHANALQPQLGLAQPVAALAVAVIWYTSQATKLQK